MTDNSCALVGLACIVYAAWHAHPGLAWLVAGVALVAIAVGGALRRKPEKSKPK